MISDDILERFPNLSKTLKTLSNNLYEVIRDIDYDICGDRSIKDDKTFEKIAIDKIKGKKTNGKV